MNRMAKIPKPLATADISAVALQDRVKELEMQVIEHRQEIDSLNIRVLRAEQKVVKLKAKVKDLRGKIKVLEGELYEDD